MTIMISKQIPPPPLPLCLKWKKLENDLEGLSLNYIKNAEMA